MSLHRFVLATLILAAVSACGDEPAPAPAETFEHDKKLLADKTVRVYLDKAWKELDEKGVQLTQEASQTCGEVTTKVRYNPYNGAFFFERVRRSTTDVFERVESATINGVPVYQTRINAAQRSLVASDKPKPGADGREITARFKVVSGHKKHADLFPSGKKVQFDIAYTASVGKARGDKEFTASKVTRKGIKVELFAYSDAMRKQLSAHRKATSPKVALAAAYEKVAAQEKARLSRLEGKNAQAARAIVDDFRARQKAAHEAAGKVAPPPFPEHRDALKLTVTCNE